MTLFDFLSSLALPPEPVDLPDAIELCGAKFRELAESDADWLWHCLGRDRDEVLELSRWVGTIGGTFPPAGMGWHEWVNDLERIGAL